MRDGLGVSPECHGKRNTDRHGNHGMSTAVDETLCLAGEATGEASSSKGIYCAGLSWDRSMIEGKVFINQLKMSKDTGDGGCGFIEEINIRPACYAWHDDMRR